MNLEATRRVEPPGDAGRRCNRCRRALRCTWLAQEPHVCFLHKVTLRRRAYLAELASYLQLSDIFCPSGEVPSTFQEVCATVRRISAFVVAEAEQGGELKFGILFFCVVDRTVACPSSPLPRGVGHLILAKKRKFTPRLFLSCSL